MNEDLISDSNELHKLNAEYEQLAKHVDYSNADSVAQFESATRPYFEKCRAFETKYGEMFAKFNFDLTERLRKLVEGGHRISEALRDEELSIDNGSIKNIFKVVVENGVEKVVGGEISCLDKSGFLICRIGENEVNTDPVDGFLPGCRATSALGIREPLSDALVEYFSEEWLRVHG